MKKERAMARQARIVVAGWPHHVTQRGNRRQRVFFEERDYQAYLWHLGETCRRFGAAVWAYCLMPNHVHLVLLPKCRAALARSVGSTHHRYTWRINHHRGWCGHLWQDRFYSTAMDQGHLLAAVRYVELNPVRAGLVGEAAAWPWSSARHHLGQSADGLLSPGGLADLIGDWQAYLEGPEEPHQAETLRYHTRSGWPLGSDTAIAMLERELGRHLRPRVMGRPRKGEIGVPA
jgi:putative transposase